MFNISFGGSNNAQEPIARFNTGGKEFETLYCRKENINDLIIFFEDIRKMDKKDYQQIIKKLKEKIK